MNKSIHQRLNAHVIAAAAAVALAVPTASLARTVSVAAIKDGLATAAFGDADGAAYTLAWGYGPADGGAATNAWAHFETLGEVAASATSQSVALPAGWGDTATHLRFFLLGPNLPAGATRVEYLQSAQNKDSPTQWIDTDVPGKAGVEAEIDFMWTAGSDSTILGSRKDSGDTRFLALHWNGSKIGSSFTTWASFSTLSAAASSETRYLARASLADGAQSLSIDGTTKATSAISSSLDTGYDMYLFAANLYGSAKQGVSAKIYSAKIWLDGDLKRNFVPCRDANNVPAMYDFVSGDYFRNGGSGSFTCGDPVGDPISATSVTALAADYGEPDAYLDYIEATGSQYIDTGVKAQSGLKAWLILTIPADSGDRSFLDARHGDLRFMMCHHVGHKAFVGHGTGDSHKMTVNSPLVPTDARFEYLCDYSDYAAPQIYIDGTNILSSANQAALAEEITTATAGDLTLFLFAANHDGAPDWNGRGKLHGCKILLSDGFGGFETLRHYLPARKNGVAGLYDKVSGKFFGSATDTAFGAPDGALPRPAELVKWVQSDGADGSRGLYIDTGVPAKAGVGMVAEMEWVAKPTTDSTVCGAMADSTHHFTLYTSAGTHQIGYANYSAFQVNTGTSVVYGGTRYRITSSLAARAQNLQVEDLDGTGYNGSRSHNDANSINAGNNLYLFARNDAGTPNQLASVRLYSLVLTNELGVVRDFIPCVADNGRAGLYDRVSERVFFPQAAKSGATSNDFDPAGEIGAVTNVLAATANAPSARLSYVESNGTSDFVDLGIIGKENVKMVAEMEWTAVPPGNDYNNVFCGASANGIHIWPYIGVADANSSAATPRMGYNGWRLQVTGTSIAADTRYRITTSLERKAQSILVEKFQNGNWVVDGNGERTNNDASWVNTELPLYLFADNAAGTASNFVAARVYSLKLWQKDGNGDYQLVRDLVPAKTTGGAVGLYDRVTTGWLFNSGEHYSLSSGGTESAWTDGFWIRFW